MQEEDVKTSQAADIIAKTFGMPSTESDEDKETESKEKAKYEFDEAFQRKITALALRHQKFARRTSGLIKPEYMENQAHAFLIDAANRYFEKYRSVPESNSVFIHYLKQRFIDTRIRKDYRQEIVDEYKAIVNESINDADYIADEIGRFAKKQAMQNAIIDAIDLLEKDDLKAVESLMSKALKTDVTDDLIEFDYWDDLERRTQKRQDKLDGKIAPNGISTGIKRLDNLLFHKGWGRKEMSVILGGAKRGKSMGLGHFSVLSCLGGYNTIYVTLEVSGEIIEDRMDANLSKIPMHELETRLQDVEDKVSLRDKTSRGVLKVVEAPSGSLSPNGLRRILERYKSDGIKFDTIVVDYADIMRPDHMTNSEIENSKQVWLGLRAIAFEENAALLTASQTNRTGYMNETAKAEDVAEDFNKIRIADLVISINRTDEERDRGEARLYFAASRNQGGEYTINIKQDLETMQFISGVVGVS